MKKTDIKKEIQVIINKLPDSEALAVKRFAEFVLERLEKEARAEGEEDEFIKMLESAPEDDEPFTDEERASEEEGWRECQRGLGRPWSEVRKELAGEKE